MQTALTSPPSHTLARSTDPGTSRAAAAQVHRFVAGQYREILDAMEMVALLADKADGDAVGASAIAGLIGLQPYQVRKRLPELQSAGLVELADGTTRTSSGRDERLWRLARS